MYVGNLIFNNNTVQLKPPLIFIEYVFLCSTKQLGHQRDVTLDSLLTNEGLNLFGDCMDKRRLSIRSNKVTLTVLHQKSFITGQFFMGYQYSFHNVKRFGIYHPPIHLLSIFFLLFYWEGVGGAASI